MVVSNVFMEREFVIGAVKFLEFLFAAGLFGSVVLILLTSVEDVREVLAAEPEPTDTRQRVS